jgi:TonB family protein
MDENNHLTEQMPASIGRYKVLEVVGFGAMGAVYRAADPLIKRTLAIKTIRLDIPRHSPQYRSFIDRFYQEARISGTLSHPNIVTLFDIAEEGGTPFLAMEFVEGETVGSLIDKGHRFKPEKVISLVSQVAAALDYAHSRGIIHRDIKPSNLMLYDGDKIKVMDFGIAKAVDAEMTQSGTLLGTPSYMSPEQAMGDKLDGRTDIFSLGVCAFEMLSGEQPFPGNNVTSILYKLVHVDPIEPANLEMNGLVPSKWHEVFGKVLAKKPDGRYQTASAFVHDLEYCLGSWFGALEDTIVQTSADLAATLDPRDASSMLPDETPTARMSAPPLPVMPGATVSDVPAAGVAPAAAPKPPSNPAVLPATPADVQEPPTVIMKLTAADPPRATAVPRPTIPATSSASELAPTVRMKAPSEVPGEDSTEAATVVIKTPPVVAAAPQGAAEPAVEPTVTIKAKLPPPPIPPRTPAASSPAPGRATPPPGARSTGAAPPRVPETASTDPTVVLSADPTVRSRQPPTAASAGRLPQETEALTRPVASGAVAPGAESTDTTPFAVPGEVSAGASAPEAASRAVRRPIPAGVFLGIAALLFVIALTALGLVVWKTRSESAASAPTPLPTVAASIAPTPAPTAAPTAPPAPAILGTIKVESQPSGATVTIGEAKGTTPFELGDLVLGPHEVRLEMRGYEPRTESVTLTPEAPTAGVKATLTRLAPVMGTADILSTPFGAAVLLDGTRVGETPLIDLKVRPGNHRVDVEKEGYESWSGALAVQAGKKGRVDAELKAVVKPTPTPAPTVEAVDPNRVYANLANEVDVLAKKISGSSVTYPDNAPRLRSGDRASVSVSFVVTENGDVTDVRVVETGGKALDEAVMAGVKNWKYSPAVKRGVKVKVRVTFKQTFLAG